MIVLLTVGQTPSKVGPDDKPYEHYPCSVETEDGVWLNSFTFSTWGPRWERKWIQAARAKGGVLRVDVSIVSVTKPINGKACTYEIICPRGLEADAIKAEIGETESQNVEI